MTPRAGPTQADPVLDRTGELNAEQLRACAAAFTADAAVR
jgi:hypothetical protein